jgi:acetylornithine/N-succinyldiaminopimelate aminotransferase
MMISQRELFLQNIAQTSEAPLMLEIESANGVYLFDKLGKKYIDLISGISVSNLGHNHPEIISAIKNQLVKHLHLMVFGEYIQNPQVELAKTLTSFLPKNLSSVYYVNSGSEAIEGALKLAKKFTGKNEIIAFKNSYHGSSHGALSIMGNEYFKSNYRPLLPGIKFIELNNFNNLNKITEKTACVILETIQGEAGVILPASEFMKSLREKCTKTGTLLILDEIQTGFGRTGKLFGFEHYNIEPDIICFAKAFGGGMPLGAFVSSKEIMSAFMTNPFLGHITTFGGHPLSCAASLKGIDILTKSDLVNNVQEKEKIFLNKINPSKNIKEMRSKGLFIAIELLNPDQVLKTVKSCLEKGLIVDWFLHNTNSIRIAPPLTITNEQLIHSAIIINDCIKNLR